MLVYEGIKSGFIDDVNLNRIVDKIYDKYKQFFGRTSESQLNSWKNSMQYMRGVLDDKEIPDNAGVAIEFNIPTTSKRIDFILSGRDNNRKDSVIIIELKQWETCTAVEGKDAIVSTFTGGGIREVAHPSYQAMSYANLIKDFNETVQLDDMDFDYDFRVLDDPNEVRRLIEEKNKENNKSRMVAGYCWNWISEGKNNTDIHDIVIPEYDFEMSWNLGNSQTWAIDPMSVNEIGCIHTCQGLEFDYVGVIIGADIRYEDGHIVTNYTKRAKTDQSLKGINKIAREEGKEEANKIADSIIKNTYRTLITRGMKGCYIYCVDKNLQEYIKNKINML